MSIFTSVRHRGMIDKGPPSNPAAQILFPAGPKIFSPILGLGVCPLSGFRPVLSLAVALTFADHTFSEARPCVSV